jgi:hypothetical protein
VLNSCVPPFSTPACRRTKNPVLARFNWPAKGYSHDIIAVIRGFIFKVPGYRYSFKNLLFCTDYNVLDLIQDNIAELHSVASII